ncbi:hypothetical protein SPRG_03933 [Saprolegnia parasitica CBS 223.65]|uniref:G-protein coupled receptors family 3 profile domain-containing protein n=1 Tax=Saprolegnia parasitica (strain CBS 223.65) TaxID=695850 RepID=A0A067CWY9_SAPPC|nr:hypothetical protein SPRG_03933 [Saprolegnia parasitica CBS 223.65]KDO31317.1 hypothetical protein SPRG_03933 [Saprolegnia parasitica CBS 223.65]|eukprot:XP_012197916.1 hypothetical protein SPRG_03933 [Saprolegnia parasitica CBS 223.65]
MDIPNVFGNCMQPGEVIHGVGETVYANGSQAYAGVFNGTVILERNSWASHDVNRAVLSILLDEVVGYRVSILDTIDGINCAERMSFQGLGRCTPTHGNGEVWPNGKLKTIEAFANATKRTTTGYGGLSGLYTLTDNVNEIIKGPASTKGSFSEPFSADYWRDYASSTELVNFYSIARANLSQLVVPSMCPNGTLGCIDGCSKSPACTEAEKNSKQCILVAMMDPGYDVGFFQALVSNSNIPAYFCFGGDAKMRDYVTSVMRAGGAVIFYAFQPDIIFHEYPGKFTRIAFPPSDPANIANATNSFGENGYGNVTSNPVKTDYPMTPLLQYISLVLKADTRLTSFVTQFQLAQLDLDNLLRDYVDHAKDATIPDPAFAAACHWVQNNYLTWSNWIMPLPLCTLQRSVSFSYQGCNASTRLISFVWNTPSPANASLPYDCDGGLLVIPAPYASSKTCAWLDANTKTWMSWLSSPPICDATFYNYTVTDCSAEALRSVLFYWLLPDPAKHTLSLECSGGASLPANITIDCDYVPLSSGTYSSMVAFAAFVLAVLVVCMILIVLFREKPVIKRSQWHLLIVLVLGGMCMCVYVILGGGAPSNTVCGARPVFASIGYTLAFGSLLLKSLRVYLVFHNKALKKNVVTVARMLHFLLGFLSIDVVILGVWYLVDFPAPTLTVEAATAFTGSVDRVSCHSSSFIFPALCIFWKAVITFIGLYISFLIRHDDGDFQESMWIFSAACVVLMGSLFLIPLAYLVALPATTSFAFCSVITLVCTLVVMGLMLGPKFARLNLADLKSSGTTTGTKTRKSVKSAKNVNTAPK